MWRPRLISWNPIAPTIQKGRHRSTNHRCYLTLLFTTVWNLQNYLWSSGKNECATTTSERIFGTRSDELPDIMTEVEHIEKESFEDLQFRYSMVHAHPLGPWQAILKAVRIHYSDWETKNASMKTGDKHPYLVLDVACGPRGEPGTTIADALPNAFVHCTDSCAIAIESVPVVALDIVSSPIVGTENIIYPSVVPSNSSPHTSQSKQMPLTLPPSNLSKSVCNLDLLNQHFHPNTMHAIVCCYGYGLSANIVDALEQAYTVLLPGGILVLGTWNYSPLLSLGHDVLTTLRSGTGDSAAMLLIQHQNDLDDGLPPLVRPAPLIEHSGPGEWELLLSKAGFRPTAIASSCHSYPMNMGSTRVEQFNLGTILIREELQHMNALGEGSVFSTDQAFWNNLRKHHVESSSNAMQPKNPNGSDVHFAESNIMWMPNNKFTLTVSTK